MKTFGLFVVSLFAVISAAHPFGPDSPEAPIKVQLLTNKECYAVGEDVKIRVDAVNSTDEDITLYFASGYQADYSIDGKYLWSWGKGFTQATTEVVIPAGGTHSWNFVHSGRDYFLSAGKHVIVGMVVGYGHSEPVTVIVGDRQELVVTVSTDKESYAAGEEISISVVITNNGSSEVVLHFPTGRQAGYSIDNEYVRFNGSDAADVYSTISLPPGGSHAWQFSHHLGDYPLAAGKHWIKGIVEGYGESEPVIIIVESGLEIGVSTDKMEYALDEPVEITVSATNNSAEAMKLTFPTTHQGNYIIDGRYNWSKNHAAPEVITEVTINPGETKEWAFTHSPEDYRLLSGPHCILGEVIGYGRSEPVKILVGGEEGPIKVSVSTDKSSYQPGEPVQIVVGAENVSGGPVTLRFPTLHQADYRIDGKYLWSDGKSFLPIPTSLTLPPGVRISWEFAHRGHEYELLPGEHTITGIVVGYGESQPVTIIVRETEPDELTVRGVLLKEIPPWLKDGRYGGYPGYFLYTGDPEKVYCLFPDNVDLEPHVNKTVEVTGHYIYTLLPVPGIPLGVTSIRDLLAVTVQTDKVEYYQQENILISVIAQNLTDEVFTMTLKPSVQVRAWVDDKLVVQDVITVPPPPSDEPITIEIPGGGTHAWTLTYFGTAEPLSPGEHFVSGEIIGYGRSERIPIKIIEKPSEKIVAEGIVDMLDDSVANVVGGVPAAPQYVLVKRDTGELLYLLRNPAIDFGAYLGQFVQVVGVLWDEEPAIPQLYVLRIRRLLAVSVSTDKIYYAPADAMNVYVTAKNCTPNEMTLTFASEEQAYYRIGPASPGVAPLEERQNEAEQTVVIKPYDMYVWKFEGDAAPSDKGDYTVQGFVNGYGYSKPATISVMDEPPPMVEATGFVEKLWWWHWHWFSPCWYILFDPETNTVSYFLTSENVPLDWYLGRYVKVTGHAVDVLYPKEIYKTPIVTPGETDPWGRLIPPIIPPWPFPGHLNVASVLPLDDGLPPVDMDGDGLRDSWEITTGLDEIGAEKDEDSDGDGMPNFLEYAFGTDPLDAGSAVRVRIGTGVAGMLNILWNTVPGKTYSVYCADDLSGGAANWRRLVGGVEGTGAEFQLTDEGAPGIAPSNAPGVRCRFYRVVVE